MPAVTLCEVVKEFAAGNVRAVDHVSFEVEEGELLVLLGPGGCSKTTTLRMIAGLEEPDASRRLAEQNVFFATQAGPDPHSAGSG